MNEYSFSSVGVLSAMHQPSEHANKAEGVVINALKASRSFADVARMVPAASATAVLERLPHAVPSWFQKTLQPLWRPAPDAVEAPPKADSVETDSAQSPDPQIWEVRRLAAICMQMHSRGRVARRNWATMRRAVLLLQSYVGKCHRGRLADTARCEAEVPDSTSPLPTCDDEALHEVRIQKTHTGTITHRERETTRRG